MQEDLIIKYLDSKLNAEENAAFEILIQNNPELKSEIESIKSLDDRFNHAFHFRVNTELSTRIYNNIIANQNQPVLIDLSKKDTWTDRLFDIFLPVLGIGIVLINIGYYLTTDKISFDILNSKYLIYSSALMSGAFLIWIMDRYLQSKKRLGSPLLFSI
jgi:hypothetical protein